MSGLRGELFCEILLIWL